MYTGEEACYQEKNKDEEFYTQLVPDGSNHDEYHVAMNSLCEGCHIQEECAITSLKAAGVLGDDNQLIL